MNDAIKPGPENPPQAAGLPQLSVVVPTFNERDNVTVLYRRLEATLTDIPWEVVFVDDNSPDGTWEVVRGLARQDSRVRCIRRIGRRGLSGACIEGILASSAPYAAVIDADLQHDETQLPKMVGAAAERRGRTRGRQPLYRGRQRRQFRQAARRRQRARDRSRQARAEGRDRRSHERLLHDPPRPLRATGAATVDPGLQDPARHRRDRARQAAHDRGSLHLRLAPARREQARFHGGAGFPGPGAGEADP